jgi:Putative bacterial sensory transduction regulator
MKHLSIAAALAITLLAAAPASAGPVSAQGVTRGEVADILAAHGMPAKLATDSKGNEIVSSSVAGINFDVYFYDCNSGRCSSIQFAAGWTNSSASQARINEWNTTKRYLRVYSKPGKIVWAEQDLVVSRGSSENIDDCLTWWEKKMITQFKTFMNL